MRTCVIASAVLALVCGMCLAEADLTTKNEQPQFKTIELKHFALAPGVELTPIFMSGLYEDLLGELQNTGVYAQVIGEGGAVAKGDAAASVVLEGKVAEYNRGIFITHLRMDVTLSSRRGHNVLHTIHSRFDYGSRLSDEKVAGGMAKKIAGDIKRELKKSAATP